MITKDNVHELFAFDEQSGILRWRIRPAKRVKIGDVAGTINQHGYFAFEFKGKSYLAHRVIWLLKTGSWPKKWIDHIDGNRSNNVISNLRDVSVSENCQNIKSHRKRNKIGLLGVTLERGMSKYAAHIRINGKQIRLGSFETPELAHSAYIQAKREFHRANTL